MHPARIDRHFKGDERSELIHNEQISIKMSPLGLLMLQISGCQKAARGFAPEHSCNEKKLRLDQRGTVREIAWTSCDKVMKLRKMKVPRPGSLLELNAKRYSWWHISGRLSFFCTSVLMLRLNARTIKMPRLSAA
jgi:hypothetical protein